FGMELSGNQSAGTTSTNPWRFAGEYWDAHTRTYYLRARHFNPRTGRFTQPDPFWNISNMQNCPASIFQSANLFLYTMHNPIKWRDPLGLYSVIAYYIAKKNDGTMDAMVCETGRNTRVTIRIGDRARTFSHDDISFIDGRIIMGYAVFMQQFGLTFEQSTHQPWDSFSSMDNAAIAFSLMYTAHATAINREIGAMIYSVTTGRGRNRRAHYTFGTPWIGAEYNVIAGLMERTIWEQGRPLRSDIAALAHTHPLGNRSFSQADRNLAHGWFNLAAGIPAMPVFMSVNLRPDQIAMYGHSLEVRRFDSSMHRTSDTYQRGRLIFSQ
ncbi:MAG: RHS repeat-associated core domain-containing protein, partial [Defluviitaleaceae bacterium]|nr:RHS repeat-associated core domain-containing protein [Defluviitaleaceae bacterium]